MLSDIESIAKSLPQIDCGSCGAPTCMAFAEILKWADLVLVMEDGHKRELLHKYPWLEGKVFRYGEPQRVDVPDPYRRPENAFVLAWNFISKLTPYWVEKIKQSETAK